MPGCVERGLKESERGWVLIDGWCGSECHGVVTNTCQCQPIHSSLICEEQSCVYQSQCVLSFFKMQCCVVVATLHVHNVQKEMGGECCGMGRRQGV